MAVLGVGCQFALHPPQHPGCRWGCGADFLPNTQIRYEWLLKIRYLQRLGVRGVGGVGQVVCMTTIRARIHTCVRLNAAAAPAPPPAPPAAEKNARAGGGI